MSLFDDETPPEPELKPMLNVSKYNVRMNGVHVAPGEVGQATPEDVLRWGGRGFLKEVADGQETPVD